MKYKLITEGIFKGAKIFGPYKDKNNQNRLHVVLIWGLKSKGTLKRETISYPKFLAETFLNKKLNKDETIDHIDRNLNNNTIQNFRVVSQRRNASEDHIRVEKVEIKCIWCNTKLVRSARGVEENSKKSRAGPFCKSCAGKYGTSIQNKKLSKLPPQKGFPKKERKYYFVEKEKIGGLS